MFFHLVLLAICVPWLGVPEHDQVAQSERTFGGARMPLPILFKQIPGNESLRLFGYDRISFFQFAFQHLSSSPALCNAVHHARMVQAYHIAAAFCLSADRTAALDKNSS